MRHLEGAPIILEGEIDVVAEILARGPLQLRALHPMPMTVIGVVDAIHVMRCPAGIRLDAHQLQIRVPIEDAAKDEHADEILNAADDSVPMIEPAAALLAIE